MDLTERRPEVTTRHPWEIARAAFYRALLRRLGVVQSTARWLDAGAGDAYFARGLRDEIGDGPEIVCWDVNYSAEDLAASSSHPGLTLSAERPAGRFDGILLLDVIEHVEDAHGFVSDLVQHSLADTGWVLVAVPAYQSLFSEHDRLLGHHRRYSARALRAVLEQSGLVVEARGGLFHALLPLRAATVLRERRSGRSAPAEGIGGWTDTGARTRFVVRVLELEGRLSLALGLRRLPPLPGLSLWAFCRPAPTKAAS